MAADFCIKLYSIIYVSFSQGAKMLSIVKNIASLMTQKGLTLSTAESCTGGLISGAITDWPGVSSFFMGSIVAYDNNVKMELLKVPKTILIKHGAVSSQTVEAMVKGVCSVLKTDCAISVSGIAGPGGATSEKPLGLVYIGIKICDSIWSYKHIFHGNRELIRRATVKTSLLHFLNNLQD